MIFLDTGAFLARFMKRDQHHDDAVKIWKRLEKRPPRLFTSNHVLDETFTLLARRAGYAFSAQRARTLLSSEVLTILRPDANDEFAALDDFERFSDQRVSFTDCVSFVLMRKRGIRKAFSFDRHFVLAGFRLLD